MELNKIYHLDFLNNSLPDKCAQLIIADPPYFEVKGDFDFIWKSFEHYLKDVEKWAIECKRILADNGNLIWYGDGKKIAYSQILLDKLFNIVSNVCIHIYDRQTNKIKPEDARGFINTTERLLLYSSKDEHLNFIERDYIRSEIIKSKGRLVLKDINQALGTACNGGGVASACLSLDKTEPMFITEDLYKKLQSWCHPFLTKPYVELRRSYDLNRRPFTPIEQYKMDVLKFSQEGHVTGLYEHDTVKPEKLTRYLINTCSRKSDLVIVPFSGSGTECAMSAKESRNFIGFDIEKKYVDMGNKRCKTILNQTNLF